MPSATIKLFLAYADPRRLRIAEISNWNGKAVARHRAELDDILAREESHQAGVYFLTGTDPDSSRNAVYIGEAEVIRDRIKNHLDKDFWNSLIFVLSKDENLTKAHNKFLEGLLIEQANKAGRALVRNGQASGSKLPESDRADMEIFLDRIHQLLPVLGADFLVPISAHRPEAQLNPLLYCKIKGIVAKGIQGIGGFLVYKGSQAVVKERDSTQKFPYARELRERLIQEGVLEKKEKWLEFVKDAEFTSPSAAASVVQGGSANGRLEWKTEDGMTLKELEEAYGGRDQMKVPNAGQAVIAEDKLCNYLLNLAHRRGASKAKLLIGMGYRPDDWQRLSRNA